MFGNATRLDGDFIMFASTDSGTVCLRCEDVEMDMIYSGICVHVLFE